MNSSALRAKDRKAPAVERNRGKALKKEKGTTKDAAGLRRLAEGRLKGRKSETGLPLAENDARRMVHELQVHQIELELQNEELKIAREELEDNSRNTPNFTPSLLAI